MALAASAQKPVGYVSKDFLDGKRSLDHIAKSDEGQISRTIPVFAKPPQPAEQQPAPDVTQLVEALEKARDAIASLPKDALGNVPDTQQCQGWHIRDELINDISTALAAHRKGDQP